MTDIEIRQDSDQVDKLPRTQAMNTGDSDFRPSARFGTITRPTRAGKVSCSFFAIVFGVNGLMVYRRPSSTFDGVEVEEPIRKGRAYNHVIERMEAQKELGWSAGIETRVLPGPETGKGHSTVLSVTFADSEGRPVEGLSVRGTFWRPVVSGEDSRSMLRETAPGTYEGLFPSSAPATGRYVSPRPAPGRNLCRRKACRHACLGEHMTEAAATEERPGIDPDLFVREDAGWRSPPRPGRGRHRHAPGALRKVEGAPEGIFREFSYARANLSTKRVAVRWDPAALRADAILRKLAATGFTAVPFDPKLLGTLDEREGRSLLRALGVAGFAAANVMLVSVSVHPGLVTDMDETTRSFFHWISALIALPAIAYAGQPFFRSARRRSAPER